MTVICSSSKLDQVATNEKDWVTTIFELIFHFEIHTSLYNVPKDYNLIKL